MSRGADDCLFVVIAGLVAASVAHFADPAGTTSALVLLASGLVIGELLVLRLENGTAVPLSYAVLLVLASSFPAPRLRRRGCGRGADLARVAHHATGRRGGERRSWSSDSWSPPRRSWSYDGVRALTNDDETVAAVLLTLGAAAVAAGSGRPRRALGAAPPTDVLAADAPRVARDLLVRDAHGDRLPRRRRARVRSASGDRCCSRRRCWRPGTRSSGSTRRRVRTARRSRRSRWRPSSAGSCRPVTRNGSRRSRRRWRRRSESRRTTRRTSRWPRCCTTSARSRSTSPTTRVARSRRRRSPPSRARCSARSSRSPVRATSLPATSTSRAAASRCRCYESPATTTT